MSKKKQAAGWEGEPKGWTNESKKKFWDSLGGSVEKCIKKMEGDVDDPGAFCASLADEIEGTDWRKGPRKSSVHREEIVVAGVKYREVNGAKVTEGVKKFFKSLKDRLSGSSEKEEASKKSCGCGRMRGVHAENKRIELPTSCVAEVIGTSFSNQSTTIFEKRGDTWLVEGVDSNGVIDDPLVEALVAYCEMSKTATTNKNKFARLNPDDFMKPEIVNDTFYIVEDVNGVVVYIPQEFIDPRDAEAARKAVEEGEEFNTEGTSFDDFIWYPIMDIEKASGWFARLSAPGYLDATEWTGPFDSEEEAENYLDELYGIDDIDVDEEEYGLPPEEPKTRPLY